MKPIICNYYITYRCNARCGFCNIWKEEKIPSCDESSPDTVIINLSDAKALGVKIVDFTGGDQWDGNDDVESILCALHDVIKEGRGTRHAPESHPAFPMLAS